MNWNFCSIEDMTLRMGFQLASLLEIFFFQKVITNLPMSNWLVLPYRRIVVGFHPLAICEDGEEGMGAKKVFESLQLIFMKFEVVRFFFFWYSLIPYFCTDSN